MSSLDSPVTARGLELLCDSEGLIREITHDEVGVSPACVGQPFWLLVDAASRSKAEMFLARLRQNQEVVDWELNVPLDNPLRTLHFTGKARPEGLHIVATPFRTAGLTLLGQPPSTEIQAREQRTAYLFEELSRLNNELVTVQRELARKNWELQELNEVRNQFLGMASHDLRTPLATIESYSRLLLEEIGSQLDDEHRCFLQIVHQSSRQLFRLINDLVDYSRMEANHLELERTPAQFSLLVQLAIREVEQQARAKQISLRFQEPPSLPECLIDETQMLRVANNLLTNAIKYSPRGQQVDVMLRAIPGRIEFVVRDQGFGIPAEKLDSLFRPFVRANLRSPTGEPSTGLGLAIVRKIVEAHGGKVTVESELGRGSTFVVSLPNGSAE